MVTTMDRFKGVKTISFDGDDTLWDFSSAMQTAMALVLQEIRHMVPTYATEQLTVPKMIEIREAVGKELGEGTVSLEQIRLVSLMRTLEYVGSPSEDMARQLYDLYMDSRLGNSRLFADVPENLMALARHYKIGLISNGNTYPEEIDRLPNVFDFVVLAQECGFPKPDPRTSFNTR